MFFKNFSENKPFSFIIWDFRSVVILPFYFISINPKKLRITSRKVRCLTPTSIATSPMEWVVMDMIIYRQFPWPRLLRSRSRKIAPAADITQLVAEFMILWELAPLAPSLKIQNWENLKSSKQIWPDRGETIWKLWKLLLYRYLNKIYYGNILLYFWKKSLSFKEFLLICPKLEVGPWA